MAPAVHHALLRAVAVFIGVVLIVTGPRPSAQEPRFRGGANLVRLDVYASAGGAAVTDLTAADFEVFEDNTPQVVSSFEVVPARGPVSEAARAEPHTVGEMRSRAAQSDGRLFVLFLDTGNVQLRGSFRAANPVAQALDGIVGADDLLGVMTADMSPGNMTLSPRTAPIGDLLRASWAWGERDRTAAGDPREEELRACYPDAGATRGIAEALIARRRERQTVRALSDLTAHLEGLRDERTFVLLLTEGWHLPGPDEHLARALSTPPPDGQGLRAGPDPIGVTPAGRLGSVAEPSGLPTPSCERERSLVALSDLAIEFRLMMQRANRANVSFYPVDARGLIVFDGEDPAGRSANPSLVADGEALERRRSAMRELAAETDGTVLVDAALDTALPRLMTDLGSHYLLGYVSTNTKLDGRYRRLTVRVTRPGVAVRARPGYLAPSAADVAAATTTAAAARRAPAPSSGVRDALSRLPVGRRPPALHLQAAGAPGFLDVTVELDRTIAARPEWADGGRLIVVVEPADLTSGAPASVTETLAPGVRVQRLRLPAGGAALGAGRYQVRVEALAAGARTPVVVSTFTDVPDTASLLGSALEVSRRGPGTRRPFEPTADARFRRTERLRAEVAQVTAGATVVGRLLNRAGQEMQVPVAISEQAGTDASPSIVAELALAPLAAGEYVLEVTATRGDRRETRSYAVRIVP